MAPIQMTPDQRTTDGNEAVAAYKADLAAAAEWQFTTYWFDARGDDVDDPRVEPYLLLGDVLRLIRGEVP